MVTQQKGVHSPLYLSNILIKTSSLTVQEEISKFDFIQKIHQGCYRHQILRESNGSEVYRMLFLSPCLYYFLSTYNMATTHFTASSITCYFLATSRILHFSPHTHTLLVKQSVNARQELWDLVMSLLRHCFTSNDLSIHTSLSKITI